MKHIIYILLLAIVAGFTKCGKEKPTISNDVPGLPPATQTGANTFGCLVNGVPWVPQGSNGTNNLSIDYDPGFNKGIFNIVAYKFTIPTSEQIIVGIRDSLNFLTAPTTLALSRNSIYSISYGKDCDWFNQHADVLSSGTLTIRKLDRNNGIISGEFDAIMVKSSCDTIKITKGRFDFKF